MCFVFYRYCWRLCFVCFFFSSRRRHTRCGRDWSSDVCSSDLEQEMLTADIAVPQPASVLLGLHHDGTGAGSEALEHQRLPVRRLYARHPTAIRVLFMRVSLC